MPGNRTRVLATAEEVSRTLSFLELVCTSSVLMAVCVATVAGNALVLLSFALDRRLRTPGNYYLLSLAVSDFLIGAFSMPLFVQYLLVGEWTLGPALCDTWLAQDYACSTASCLNLLAIGVDRYLAVTQPLRHRTAGSRRRALITIACVWAAALLVWPPWIIGWQFVEGFRSVPDHDCYVQFLETNFYLTAVASLLDYYAPLALMLGLYFAIWRHTRRRRRFLEDMEAALAAEDTDGATRRCLACCSGRDDQEPKTSGGEASAETGSTLLDPVVAISESVASDEEPASDRNTLSVSATPSLSSKLSPRKQNDKAAWVLTAILLAFVLTTTPYNVLVIVKYLDSSHSLVPDGVWHFFYYLFYVNSTLNPACYALANKNFRRTYWKILTCSWSAKSRGLGHSSYRSSRNVRCTTSL